MKSPLPPRLPNPLKRKLAIDTLPENVMVGVPDSGVQEQIKHAEKQLNCQCRCSFLEIYNEKITDLLDPSQRNLHVTEALTSKEYACTMKDVTQLLIKFMMYIVLKWKMKREIEETVSASTFAEPSFPLQGKVSTRKVKLNRLDQGSIPPPGRGQRIYEIDPTLTGFRQHLDTDAFWYGQYKKLREDIDSFVAWAIVNRYVLLFLECALTELKPIQAVPWVKKVTDSGHKIERRDSV
ncbi:hypothetical protein Pint_35974 [Pistacia integerrima]|uniref:Uncharacterized protein n=1 Tax=Pistacia integerrima TaxID=434235 RepID=A0ACC0Y2M8_9ROSI|nr:hypothetical protein Pint_35974 [Pistacia integerrima]